MRVFLTILYSSVLVTQTVKLCKRLCKSYKASGYLQKRFSRAFCQRKISNNETLRKGIQNLNSLPYSSGSHPYGCEFVCEGSYCSFESFSLDPAFLVCQRIKGFESFSTHLGIELHIPPRSVPPGFSFQGFLLFGWAGLSENHKWLQEVTRSETPYSTSDSDHSRLPPVLRLYGSRNVDNRGESHVEAKTH